ncbi:hypothetical protein BATDEDRAFT_36313 [Batrachochytrium dendrobatidis JAM81]|uniref:Uncharacterized protein n=2 Tax=Batrachochytrium dendrobatidis TaxID=109871 RepID=F4PF83_BATDJ|nr:uncharacterized protein BATDEDRAFT_36313 [Batrachochytrium dendrobatidis JAM81]EGF76113.1 hypothetical protein BATDEDRAFT_36313 [Batrachochytrium dendrobatidis JAM81]KAJ8322800.1 hypothetical protein O5D80_008330 [Batrachochytrium dendrobatidis]KAK5665884.1 hypothetical protein QVD99_007509 [Batrachochytrium dendrobatidis]OAJ42823.1 hypothetical protein BDEG_26233 [Batrachochytrium dendrobatidis JEL423]|eukprot:XP_006683266.1 hypothetical protein BATDEDRAFT_36313 [Batrachochytrium dendrobatidis JAM81]
MSESIVGFVEAGSELGILSEDGKNCFNIYCPSCKSFILRKLQGSKLFPTSIHPTLGQDLTNIRMPSIHKSDNCSATASPFFWLVSDMMQFENIGFSRPIHDTTTNTKVYTIDRYLSCADCDLGPLGCSVLLADKPDTSTCPSIVESNPLSDQPIETITTAAPTKLLMIAADRVRYKLID